MKDFFERMNALGKPKRADIIEKDFHLHRILHEISQEPYLSDKLAFKGGTCLIKAHMGYHRFSEDVDFTWRDESVWKGQTLSETKRQCAREINEVLKRFKTLSDELGFSFRGEKSVTEEVHISSGGRMVFLWLGYDSEVLGVPSRVKVEINFVDRLLYPLVERELRSYAESFDSREMAFLYEKPWKEYSARVVLPCYDAREIFVEKCRASLTRKAYKMRDAVDLVYMEEKYGYHVSDFRPQVLEKIRFMRDTYERYRENLEIAKGTPTEMGSEDEMRLLLGKPAKNLAPRVRKINAQLEILRKEILAEQ